MAEAIAPGRPDTIPDRIRETSRDYANPYRPFPLRLVNSLAPAPLLDTKSIIRSAAKAAGLPRTYTGDDPAYREGLEVLVDSIESEARLNPVGKMIIRGRLTGVLKARFRAETLLKSRPEILDQTLAAPIVITGLQRTGTTLLHRLLASDRRFRSLSSWEVLDPVPSPGLGGVDSRLRAAQRAEKGAAWMSPDFFAVHPIDHRAPEEDVLLLDNSFRSTVAEAILRVPSYAAWLEQADSTPAYEFMRKLLLIFQSEDARPNWILKSPHHLEFLDVMMTVFPETKVIQTHRDPVKTTGSFLSMVAHGYGMFSDSPNPQEIGRHWNRKCRRMVAKGMQYRKSLDAGSETNTFLDIQFTNLISDPIGTLEKIYAFRGLEFDGEAEASARNLLNQHGRHRYGRHVYSLSDFGLTADGIRSDFREYRSEYAIPDEE